MHFAEAPSAASAGLISNLRAEWRPLFRTVSNCIYRNLARRLAARARGRSRQKDDCACGETYLRRASSIRPRLVIARLCKAILAACVSGLGLTEGKLDYPKCCLEQGAGKAHRRRQARGKWQGNSGEVIRLARDKAAATGRSKLIALKQTRGADGPGSHDPRQPSGQF